MLAEILIFLKSFATSIRLVGSRHRVSLSDFLAPPPSDSSLAFPQGVCGRRFRGEGFCLPGLRLLALRGVAAAFLVAFVALFVLPLQAQAQSTITFVSNIGQTAESSGLIVGSLSSFQFSRAQQFTTGDNADGYTLSELVVNISASASSTDVPRVSIYSDASGSPATSLYTLTNPASFANGDMTFTAPANATLAKETVYWVLLEETAPDSYSVGVTRSGSEGTAESGWSIADRHLSRTSDGGTWSYNSSVLLMTVNGTVGGTTPTDTLYPSLI